MESSIASETELVASAVASSDQIAQTIAGREGEPAFEAYARYGVPWWESACQTAKGLESIASYKARVSQTSCSAWMDNTTLLTAGVLMSSSGNEAITPLTVWDLSTFARAVVCYDRIYHHVHKAIDDKHVNNILGAEVLVPIPLPTERIPTGSILPEPWIGAHRFMCDVWSDAHG